MVVRAVDRDAVRRVLADRANLPADDAQQRSDEAAATTIDGQVAMRSDGTPRVPSFLQPLMEQIVATGNHLRLVRAIDAEAMTAFIPLRQCVRDALQHYLARPHPAEPPKPTSAIPLSPVHAPRASSPTHSKEWPDSKVPSPSGMFSLSSVASELTISPAVYVLLDGPSFSIVRASAIPTFSSLPLPHLFPPTVSPTHSLQPLTLTALSQPFVDPFIRSLLHDADNVAAHGVLERHPPPSSPATVATTDPTLSSLVYHALSVGCFCSPPALPLLQLGLLQPLQDRFLSSGAELHRVLLSRCSLLSCLAAFRDFFLSADGVLLDDLMSVFRSSSPSTAHVTERLNDTLSSLPSASPSRQFLAGRMRAAHGERASFSSISSSFTSTSVSLLLSLTFHCDVAWPLDAIVTADHLRKYNAVLHLILHLRVSLHVLSRLSHLSSGRQSSTSHPLAHQFNLFKAAVHHCIRVLHDYVLTHATTSGWPSLLSAVQSTSSPVSLAALRDHHSAYLERILQLCLLTPNLSAAFAALQKIVGGVGAVESLGRLIMHDLLDHTIDDEWDMGHHSADADADEDDDWLLAEDDNEHRLREERRRKRRVWRSSLSSFEQADLQRRYAKYRSDVLSDCWRRLAELRTGHDRNVRFFLTLIRQIATHGRHSHRKPRLHLRERTTSRLLALPLTARRASLSVRVAVAELATNLNFNAFYHD